MKILVPPQVQKARRFSAKKHAGQLYGSHPYVFHLAQVEDKVVELYAGLLEYDHIIRLRILARLHDIVEDTDATSEEIELRFGLDMSESVSLISTVEVHPEDGTPLKYRREKHVFTYPRIASKLDVILVKLADRLANVSHAKTTGGPLKMYMKEHPKFRSAIRPYTPEKFMFVWDILDELLEFKGN